MGNRSSSDNNTSQSINAINVLLLGSYNSGKTVLLNQINQLYNKNNQHTNTNKISNNATMSPYALLATTPTTGVELCTFKYRYPSTHTLYKIQLNELGSSMSSTWHQYYTAQYNTIIYCINTSQYNNNSTYSLCCTQLVELCTNQQIIQHHIHIVIVLNNISNDPTAIQQYRKYCYITQLSQQYKHVSCIDVHGDNTDTIHRMIQHIVKQSAS